MPSLKEIRKLLRIGIGNLNPPGLRGVAEIEDENEEIFDENGVRFADVDQKTNERIVPPDYAVSSSGGDAILRFGKHSGAMLSDVYKSDPEYVGWMIRKYRGLTDAKTVNLIQLCEFIINEKTKL